MCVASLKQITLRPSLAVGIDEAAQADADQAVAGLIGLVDALPQAWIEPGQSALRLRSGRGAESLAVSKLDV